MPSARRSRTIAAPAEELWELICDPHHLPRWWPRVTRVEGVEDRAFTEVMVTKKGRTVRADFDITRIDPGERVLVWTQRLEGTPFAHVLSSAETELHVEPVPALAASAFGDAAAEATGGTGTAGASASEVTIELRQEIVTTSFSWGGLMRGRRGGGLMVRRAAAATIDEALNGLERING